MANTKYYFNFNIPWPVFNFAWLWLGNQNNPNNPTPTVDPANREWFSQPRTDDEVGTEVITATFRLPLSISEITMDILRMPCVTEVWYQDRSNNWRQVLDMQRIPLRINVGRSDAKSYFKYHTKVYPIVAKQVQVRMTRTKDLNLAGTPFPVGLRNVLLRRNVYDRSQGNTYLEDDQDILGNVSVKYIKDWDAGRAIDDNPTTFWKSSPMPDPAAVASLYLDVRDELGVPKSIDRVYIDPVYTGQQLNLYYSSDDTVGTRKLSPITIVADADEDTDWKINRGRSDVSTGSSEAFYRWSLMLGPQIAQEAWVGVEWTPDFSTGGLPPNNPILFRAMDPVGPSFKPSLYYDVGAGEFTLEFSDGTDIFNYSATMTADIVAGDPLRIVAGWKHDPKTVYISVRDRHNVEVANFEDAATDLPNLISLDGQVEMYRFRGLITALVVKLEDYAGSEAFQVSPTYYVDPDPVIPDANGVIPSTTLDNAVYAYPAVTQEHGTGGMSDTVYENKEWTPIWRNYLAQKGMLYFPQAISMKYLKLEFTNLTVEPYPVYDSGIEVRYKVFPVSVLQQSTVGFRMFQTGRAGFLGLGTFIGVNGVTSINWMDPAGLGAIFNGYYGSAADPVQISDGVSFITESLPNAGSQAASTTRRLEFGSAYVYRRDVLQPYILAEDAYNTTIKAEGLQQIAMMTDVPWNEIEEANPGAITHIKSTGTVAIRGTDWWVYPGQRLRVPAAVMQKLTDTETVVERKFTTETRVRFNTTSVHRYEWKTLKRDAALAYFAGVREVQPYASTYIAGEDKPYFEFPHYDTDQFVTDNIVQNDIGATSTLRRLYIIANRLFERNLNDWLVNSNVTWAWDGTKGRWLRGTARCTADGNTNTIMSAVQDAEEGEEIDFVVALKWKDLTGLDPDDVAIRWGIRTFNGVNQVEEVALEEISYTDWTTHDDSEDEPTHDETWLDRAQSYTIGAGVTGFRFFCQVTNQVGGGQVWFENVNATATNAATAATVFKSVETASTFTKVAVDFRDSGLWRGDSMWADINPDSESIEDTKLAYYTRTIPETVPGGMWDDAIKVWGAEDTEWGSPFAIVSITVDNNRRYQGRRVLHFRRAAGAGEAGIKVKQWTHFVPLGLFRLGAVFYKPLANDNQLTLRLRRLSDGVFVYEETVEAPAGRWYEYQSKFVEIPDSPEQEYEVYLTLEGDDEDELYLADLYTELALIRYFVKLGGVGGFLHEVTDLRYSNSSRVYVSTTSPVNEVSIQAAIMSPESWALGARVTPSYLK